MSLTLTIKNGAFAGTDMTEFKMDYGCYSWVLLFDKYIVKIPRDTKKNSERLSREGLQKVCKIQNELYEKFPEFIIPVHLFDNLMISPIPDGKLGICYEKTRPELRERLLKIKKQIEDCGYFIGDPEGWANFFYDEKTDSVKLIDYGALRKVYTHVVTTRMLYTDDNEFYKRLELYKKYTLKSLREQTNKNFDIAVLCNRKHATTINSLNVIPFFVGKDNFGQKDKTWHCKVPWTEIEGLDKYDIQSNIDSDDFISKEYVELIQSLSVGDKSIHIHFQPVLFNHKTGEYHHNR
jgi:hypothetical protein